MTREEAIGHIKDVICENNTIKPNMVVFEQEKEALCMAIKALEQESCEDAVSRAEVLKGYIEIERADGMEVYSDKAVPTEYINNLPPVTPKQRTGHWFVDERPESDREIICSNCEQSVFKYHKMDFDYRPAYCPHCGAKMGGE